MSLRCYVGLLRHLEFLYKGWGLDRRGGRLDFCMLVSAFLVDKNAMPSLKVGKN